MNFFTNIVDTIKRKKAELDDRRAFLDEVEAKTKPIRRAAYMKQMFSECVNEGVEKAKADAAKKVSKVNTQQNPSGLMEGINNPYKFLEGHPAFQKTKSKGGNKK